MKYSSKVLVKIAGMSALSTCLVACVTTDVAPHLCPYTELDRNISEITCSRTESDLSNNDWIAQFPHLVKLDLSKNNVELVDLSNNELLQWLNLSGNQVRDLDLSANTQLNTLLLDKGESDPK